MIEIRYTVSQITFNCKVCKAKIIRDENIPHRKQYEVECPHCGVKHYVYSTLKIKHRISLAKDGLQRTRQKTESQNLFDQCQDLWSELIKAKAGYNCEISGEPASKKVLNSHHINGKKTNYMRFLVGNGICITSGWHLKAHSSSFKEREEFLKELKRVRGDDIIERLKFWDKIKRKKTDLKAVKAYLENQLKLYR